MARKQTVEKRGALTSNRRKVRPHIGDVFEVRTRNGLAYLQYLRDYPNRSPLIRVLPGLYDDRPEDLSTLVMGPSRFVMFYPIQSAGRDPQLTAWVGTFEIPPAELAGHLFRRPARVKDYRTISWDVWDGERDIRRDIPLPLPEDIRYMSDGAIYNHAGLIDALEPDWTWATALDEYIAEESSAPHIHRE